LLQLKSFLFLLVFFLKKKQFAFDAALRNARFIERVCVVCQVDMRLGSGIHCVRIVATIQLPCRWCVALVGARVQFWRAAAIFGAHLLECGACTAAQPMRVTCCRCIDVAAVVAVQWWRRRFVAAACCGGVVLRAYLARARFFFCFSAELRLVEGARADRTATCIDQH
jgi:hypothetical protein